MIREFFARLRHSIPEMPTRRQRRLIAFLRRYSKRPLNIVGFAVLAVINVVALSADFLASERPLAYKIGGELRVLPGLYDEAMPGMTDNASALNAVRERGGWVLLPPVPYGPNQTKVAGRVSRLEPPSGRHLLGTEISLFASSNFFF